MNPGAQANARVKPLRYGELDRTVVVSAALRVAERGGMRSVTVRSLATELGLSTTAMYRYVDGKAELLNLIAEATLASVELPETGRLENVVDDFAAGLFAPGRLTRSPHLGRAFVTDMLDAGSTSVCAALRAIADWDATDRLSGLRCPATVIAGDAEPDLERQSLLARLIVARFEVLNDTGHLAPLEAPVDVARAIAEMAKDVRRSGRISGGL